MKIPSIDRKLTQDDWSEVFRDLCSRWRNWEPTEREIGDWWAYLSSHTRDEVWRAVREVAGRYSTNGVPQLTWFRTALASLPREKRPDDGTETVRVMDTPPRERIIEELERFDWQRVMSRAQGHWLQRAEVRAANPDVPEDPRRWTDLLLQLTWASVRVAQGMEIPYREVTRAAGWEAAGEESGMRRWVEDNPGGQLEEILRAPKRVQGED